MATTTRDTPAKNARAVPRSFFGSELGSELEEAGLIQDVSDQGGGDVEGTVGVPGTAERRQAATDLMRRGALRVPEDDGR